MYKADVGYFLLINENSNILKEIYENLFNCNGSLLFVNI